MKLLAFDLDGTILDDKKHISQRNLEAIEAAQKAGVTVVPASGRVYDFMPEELKQLSFIRYFITSNGANIYDREERHSIFQAGIAVEKAKALIRYLESLDIFTELYIDGLPWAKTGSTDKIIELTKIYDKDLYFIKKKYNYTDSFEEILSKPDICLEKINLPFLTAEEKQQATEFGNTDGSFALTSSFPGNLEFNDKHTNKGVAVSKLAKLLGIAHADVMCIGDNGNDVEMLKFAGISVAMSNATPEAKAAAKFITGDCNDSGFAEAVLKFL